MPGRASEAGFLQNVGVIVALAAIVGYAVFGWQFGGTSDTIPIGVVGHYGVIAIGWTIVRLAR